MAKMFVYMDGYNREFVHVLMASDKKDAYRKFVEEGRITPSERDNINLMIKEVKGTLTVHRYY